MEIEQDLEADRDGNCLVARLDMTNDGQKSKLEAEKCEDKNYFVCEVSPPFFLFIYKFGMMRF
jgi:hypothetical protein